MPLDREVFRTRFQRFKERIRSASGREFSSFRNGLSAQWEGYKERLRHEALTRLQIPSMRSARVGSGTILKQLIECVEISATRDVAVNNLVRWQNRYGHANRSHHALLDARSDPSTLTVFESWTREFFLGELPPDVAFEQFRKLVGSRYDLIAYLFFLKDWDRYMPIAPTTFDTAFSALRLDLSTSHQCSWSNYEVYNGALREIQTALAEEMGAVDVRLIDAHSFCWLLVRHELGPMEPGTSSGSRRPSVNIYDARKKSIAEMAYTAINTVKGANGQQVTVTKKEKESTLDQYALEAYISGLLSKQEEKCALTGIPLQYRGDHTDYQLLASLDRIDSDGPYAEGNLQVVCRFVNQWKSDTPNSEFIRLLALVRRDDF
jgi:hypothetical protein